MEESHLKYRIQKETQATGKTPPSQENAINVISDNSKNQVYISFMNSAKFLEYKYCVGPIVFYRQSNP